MNMIERVARAMHDRRKEHFNTAEDWEPWEEMSDQYKSFALNLARGAIEAMLEPNHDMTGSVLEAGEDRTGLVSTYQAMIREALK